MDKTPVPTDTTQNSSSTEARSLSQEVFRYGASLVFGEKSKITDAITTYAPEALSTAAYFLPGKRALVAAAAFGALNEVHTNDTLKEGVVDATLGTVKGAATKLVFDKLGGIRGTQTFLDSPLKGVMMGSASTAINTGLTRNNYEQDGKYSLTLGLERTASAVLSPQALLVDAASFSFASGGTAALGKLSGGLLTKSPVMSKLVMGTTFGLASGGVQEVANESNNGKGYDIGKIASQAAIHGLVDGLAAGPAAFKGGFAPGVPHEPIATNEATIIAKPSATSGAADLAPDDLVRPTEDRLISNSLRNGGRTPEQTSEKSARAKGPKRPIRPVDWETTLQDGTKIKITPSRGEKNTEQFVPLKLTADGSVNDYSISRVGGNGTGISEWQITGPGGGSFNVNAEVSLTKDGILTVSGRQLDVHGAKPDDIASMFMVKPDITPGVDTQLQNMQQILAPLSDSGSSIEERNVALSDIHSFVRLHRSPGFVKSAMDWLQHQPPEIQQTMSRYYDNSVNVSARQNSFLRDSAFQMMREGLLSPSVISDATSKFGDVVDKSTRLTEQQKTETTQNILNLLDDGNDPKTDKTEKKEVPPGMYKIAALQAAMHVADPDTITQYAHPTCALASLEVAAYTRTPDVATRLVSDVLTTGKFVTTDGTVISIDPFSLRPEAGSNDIDSVALNQHGLHEAQVRSYASQVFQTTAANVWWQTRTEAPDGTVVPRGSMRYELHYDPTSEHPDTPAGYVVDYSGPAPQRWLADGYYPHEIRDISNLISHEINANEVPNYALQDLDIFKRWLASAPRDNMPMSISVDARYLKDDLAGEPDILAHAINVHASFDPVTPGGSDKWLVAIKNPWNGRAEFITIPQLWNMSYLRDGFKGPNGQDSQTMVPISASDFEKARGR
jgi:hypothetical protein